MNKKVHIIGAGFSGLAAAATLAKAGQQVTVFEKNSMPGGRAAKLETSGFTFDMGPTWYWLPDVFDNFFAHFGKKTSDYYQLERLDPSYRTFFPDNDIIDLPANVDELYALFEKIESGSAVKLKKFLKEAQIKYDTGINKLVHKPGNSLLELMEWEIIKNMLRVKTLPSVAKTVRKEFKDERLRRILEFPVIFLGAKPDNIPSVYTLMNYADMVLGTWYPKGGMYSVVDGMYRLAKESGVKFRFNAPVEKMNVTDNSVTSISINGINESCDAVIASADYRHVEQELIDKPYRRYSEKYWDKRQMSPSAMLFYLGVDKPLKGLLHHNLFFDTDFDKHSADIYDNPQWPEDPALYVSVSTKTDKTGAPEGHENVIILIPVASGLQDSDALKEKYYKLAIDRLEKITGQSIGKHVVYKKAYSQSEFKADYNAFGGNAYGLANTLNQTAILKPKLRSNKLKNLFYAGQLTTPGPGVPPSIISGMVSAKELIKDFNR